MTRYGRKGGHSPHRGPRRTAVGLALLVIILVTLTPTSGTARLPFWCVSCGSRPAVDLVLNVLLFLPFGCALMVAGVRPSRVLLSGLGLTVAIELLQLVVPGRFPSARDLIANGGGVVLGIFLAAASRSLLSPAPRTAARLALAGAAIWVGTQGFTAWALGPAPPPSPWWSQIAPVQDQFPSVFTGTVLAASMGPVGIFERDLMDRSDEAREALGHGAWLRVVTSGGATGDGLAPILVLVGGWQSEAVLLGQDGNDAVFRLRVRGSRIGLRTPALRLSEAFAPAARDEPMELAGAYSGGRYELRAAQGTRVLSRRLAASPSWGWALLAPVPSYAFGREVRSLTAAWLFVVLLPIGAWAARMRWGREAAALLGAALVAGLAVAPLLFGLPIAHGTEWLAALAGAAAGLRIGSRTAQAPAESRSVLISDDRERSPRSRKASQRSRVISRQMREL